ncbi:Protein SRG1, partial [Bienertia sinuspersici]
MAATTNKAPSLKPVQEILQNGVVPENYIQSNDGYENEFGDDSLPMTDDLKVDFSLLSSSTHELTQLRRALSSWGCVQVVNHGIPSSLLEEVREMSKQFFTLPQEEKDKYSSKENSLEGYGNDNATREGSFNLNDKLHLQ